MNNVLLIVGIICAVLAVLSLLMAVFLFFRLDIRGAIKSVKGSPSKRQISEIRERANMPRLAQNPVSQQQTWNGAVSNVDRVWSTGDSGGYTGNDETPDVPLGTSGQMGAYAPEAPMAAAAAAMAPRGMRPQTVVLGRNEGTTSLNGYENVPSTGASPGDGEHDGYVISNGPAIGESALSGTLKLKLDVVVVHTADELPL